MPTVDTCCNTSGFSAGKDLEAYPIHSKKGIFIQKCLRDVGLMTVLSNLRLMWKMNTDLSIGDSTNIYEKITGELKRYSQLAKLQLSD